MKHYITNDPPCAFVEAVVGGYSPIDKHICKFARIAAKLRAEPGWTTPSVDVWSGKRRGAVNGFRTDAIAGEMPWR